MQEPVDKDEISRRMRAVLAAIPGIRCAYVYGSFLSREDFRDIDVALLLRDGTDAGTADRIAADAGDRLENALGFRHECDVRVLNGMPAWLVYEIISTGKTLFIRDEKDRIDFETGVMIEYLDMRETWDLFDQEYLARVLT